MNETLDYYEEHAQEFAQATLNADLSSTQDFFLSFLHADGKILDFGCGAGRDSLYFLKKGFQVTAADGSEKMCAIASRNTGLPVRHMLFNELDAVNEYDGIWACSSILHLNKEELEGVLSKMIKALKGSGIIYLSFKYGNFEGERNGRYFTDFTQKAFDEFLKDVPGAGDLYSGEGPESDLVQRAKDPGGRRFPFYWITPDARPGREEEKWLNILLKKR